MHGESRGTSRRPFMHRDDLPQPRSRRRYAQLAGSADALALARLAAAERPVAVVSATTLDAQRLVEELAWFAPGLRVCLLPDWETLPYDQFSPHQDLVSERLATLYRIQRGEFDLAVVPAPTALVRLCPPSYLAAHTFFLERRAARRRRVAPPAAAGRLPARNAGGRAGRILRARRAHRPVPDGQRAAATGSTCSTTRSTPFAPSTSTRQRTLYPVQRDAAAAGARVPAGRSGPGPLSQPLPRAVRGRPVQAAASTRTSAMALRRPASNTTCRCSSTRPPRCSTTCRKRPRWRCTTTSRPRSSAFWQRRAVALQAARAATASGRCWRLRSCSFRPRSSTLRAQRLRARRPAARGRARGAPTRRSRRPRCPRSPSSAAPPTRSRP